MHFDEHMLPYYLLVTITFLFTIFDFVRSRNIRLLAYVPLCALLVVFVGFRSLGTDNDSINYEQAFDFAGGLSWTDLFLGDYTDKMERGYLLLNKLVFTLGGNIHVVFILMALLTGLVNYALIFKNSPMPFFSVLIYVCFFYFYRDFTQIRYALSAGIGIWVIFLFINRKYLKCSFLVFVAAFIHSAVLIVPVFCFLYALGRNYWLYFLLPVVGLIGSFYNPVMYLFSLGGLPPILANYVEQDEFGRGGYMLSAIAQVFMLGMLIFKDKMLRFYDKRMLDLFFIALSLASFINLLFISFAIMQRLSSLLFGVIVFVMPYIFRVIETNIQDRDTGLLLRFVFIVFVLYYGLNMIDLELMRPYSIL